MKLFKKIISYWRDMARSKRLNKWYRKKLLNRNSEEFQMRWTKLNVTLNSDLLEKFADIMELPNTFIYPNDRVYILFNSPYNDLREVEAIMLFEEKGIIDLDNKSIHGKYRYAKSLFIRIGAE